MTYSDIVGLISGALQFAVACYALRVSRRFGLARVGWYFFGAFSLLALVHVLVSVRLFGLHLQLDAAVNVVYEVVAVLLLACLAHAELLLSKSRQEANAEQRIRLAQEPKADQAPKTEQEPKTGQESAELAAVNRQLLENMEQLQAEVELHKQAQVQTEKTHQEQVAGLSRSEEALRDLTVQLQTELDQQKQLQEQLERTYQVQLDALRQSEGEWRQTAARLEAEAASRIATPIAPPAAELPRQVAAEAQSEAQPVAESLPAATETPMPERPLRSSRSRARLLKQAPARTTRRSGNGAGGSSAKRRTARS